MFGKKKKTKKKKLSDIFSSNKRNMLGKIIKRTSSKKRMANPFTSNCSIDDLKYIMDGNNEIDLYPVFESNIRLSNALILKEYTSKPKGSKKETLFPQKKYKFNEIKYEELEIKLSIGCGGSSSYVYHALWKGIDVAYKCFKTDSYMFSGSNKDKLDGSFGEFEREAEIFAKVNHPNILIFYGATLLYNRIGIVLEYCLFGDMGSFLLKNRIYPIKERMRMLIETAGAVKYLHSQTPIILHRDLKLDNILLDKERRTKLMDFGLSKTIVSMSSSKTTRIGTPMYMSPEITRNNSFYTEKTDVYSFAMVMLIVLSGNFKPYGNIHNVQFAVARDANYRPKIELNTYQIPKKEIENDIKDLIKCCWDDNQLKRPSIGTVERMLKRFDEELKKCPEYSINIQMKAKVFDYKDSNIDKIMEKLKEDEEEAQIISGSIEDIYPNRKPVVLRLSEVGKKLNINQLIQAEKKAKEELEELMLKDPTLEDLQDLVASHFRIERKNIIKLSRVIVTPTRRRLQKFGMDESIEKLKDEEVNVIFCYIKKMEDDKKEA